MGMGMNWTKVFSLRKTSRELPTTARRTFSWGVGQDVNADTSMKVSAFYRGVIYISTQVSKLPWEIKDKNYAVLENDPIGYLLNVAPNREMTAFHFKNKMIQDAIIKGNAYAEIERDMLGRPVAIWPLNGYRVEPWRDPQDGVLYYKVTSSANAVSPDFVRLDLKDVFHIKNFHTADGLVGQSIVEFAREALGITIGADRLAGGLFANAGLPSGFLSTDKLMSDEAYSRLKDSWKEQYTGRKAGSVAILEEGVKFETIDVDPQVLQFLESRKFGVLEIARFLGLPPGKLFDTSRASFSNVENANLEVATDTLDAWAINLESEADVKLLSNQFAGKFTQIDLDQLFRGDATARTNYYQKMMGSGAMTPNEIRRSEGKAPYAEGGRYYIAVNNFTPADRVDEVIDAQIKKSEAPSTGGPTKQKPDTQVDSTKAELERAAALYLTSRK